MRLFRILILLPIAFFWLAISVLKVLPQLSNPNEFSGAMGYLLLPLLFFVIVLFAGRKRGTPTNPPSGKA